MNAAALTEFLRVIQKRLQEEINEGLHDTCVENSIVNVQTSIKSAMAITEAAILPQEKGPDAADSKPPKKEDPKPDLEHSNLPDKDDPDADKPLPD